LLPKRDDPQIQKIKELATKWDLPKRIEIKELELALMRMVQFQDLEAEKKKRVCREVAFIIKDLSAMYNMCNEGAPQIQMEFLGYRTAGEEAKTVPAKATSFKYYNLHQAKKLPRFPISDHLTQKAKEEAEKMRLEHEDELKFAEGGEDYQKPYSDQEFEIHRIRDRVRIRLNMIDIDFRNLEQELVFAEETK